MLPNPWLLLGTFVVWASTLVGVWFYKGHVDGFQLQATVQTIAVKSEAAVNKAQKDADDKTTAMKSKQQEVVNTYEAKLASNAASLADERDTSNRLRSAVALYASSSSVPGTTELSLQQKLDTISGLYQEALDDGTAASAEADAANAKRDACERWSLIVKPN